MNRLDARQVWNPVGLDFYVHWLTRTDRSINHLAASLDGEKSASVLHLLWWTRRPRGGATERYVISSMPYISAAGSVGGGCWGTMGIGQPGSGVVVHCNLTEFSGTLAVRCLDSASPRGAVDDGLFLVSGVTDTWLIPLFTETHNAVVIVQKHPASDLDDRQWAGRKHKTPRH